MWNVLWIEKVTGEVSSGGQYQSKQIAESLLVLLPKNYPEYEYSIEEVE